MRTFQLGVNKLAGGTMQTLKIIKPSKTDEESKSLVVSSSAVNTPWPQNLNTNDANYVFLYVTNVA